MMEGYISTEDLFVKGWPNDGSQTKIRDALLDINGVEHVDITGKKIHFEFYPNVVSKNQITGKISSLGCLIKTEKQKKGFFSRYVERMAETNRRQFGNERLDCCKLNKRR
jgi:hypothetical protein